MHSVVDMAGINELSHAILVRAAGGVCGMAKASDGPLKTTVHERPLIAVTEFKFAERCVKWVLDGLPDHGYDVIVWHANGTGDRAMDELIEQGLYDGVIDVVPAGVSEFMFGGNRAAGPHRLEAAGRVGIPQVIAPSGFDMLSCGPLERRDNGDQLWASRNLAERAIFVPDAMRVQVRTTAAELVELAGVLAAEAQRRDRAGHAGLPHPGVEQHRFRGPTAVRPGHRRRPGRRAAQGPQARDQDRRGRHGAQHARVRRRPARRAGRVDGGAVGAARSSGRAGVGMGVRLDAAGVPPLGVPRGYTREECRDLGRSQRRGDVREAAEMAATRLDGRVRPPHLPAAPRRGRLAAHRCRTRVHRPRVARLGRRHRADRRRASSCSSASTGTVWGR